MLNERIFLIGPTGAGKTTIGKRIAAHYGLAFHDLDQAIEKRTGADAGLIFDIEGEAGFRKRESKLLRDLSERTGIVLATGAGAVLAEENQRLLRARGFVIYLQTRVEQQIRRLSRDKRRPLLQKPNRREILQEMARVRNPIYESIADLVVPSENLSVPVMARRVIQRIEETLHDMVR